MMSVLARGGFLLWQRFAVEPGEPDPENNPGMLTVNTGTPDTSEVSSPTDTPPLSPLQRLSGASSQIISFRSRQPSEASAVSDISLTSSAIGVDFEVLQQSEIVLGDRDQQA